MVQAAHRPEKTAPTTTPTQLLDTLFEAWDLVVAELEEEEPVEVLDDDEVWLELELTTPPCTAAGAVLVLEFLAKFL